MRIFLCGNSHVFVFSGENRTWRQGQYQSKVPPFFMYYIGAALAYNFYDNHFLPKIIPFVLQNVSKKDDYVCMMAGEVDIRAWLIKIVRQQNRTIEDVVEECFNRFFRCFIHLQNDGYKQIFIGPHCSTNGPEDSNKDSPVVGSVYERNRAGLIWTELAEKKCKEYGIPFVSIFRDFLNEDMTTKDGQNYDYCHLDSKNLPLYMKKIQEAIKNV